MLDFIAKAKKAIAAFAGSAIVAYVAASQDGQITETEWIVIAGSLVVGAATYFLKNRPASTTGEVQVKSGPAPY